MATLMMAGVEAQRSLQQEDVEALAEFLSALKKTGDTSGLEPVPGAADQRIRLGRVSGSLTAILFVLDAGGTVLCYAGAYVPREAASRARTLLLQFNPINGMTTLVQGTPDERGETISADELERAATILAQAPTHEAVRKAEPQVEPQPEVTAKPEPEVAEVAAEPEPEPESEATEPEPEPTPAPQTAPAEPQSEPELAAPAPNLPPKFARPADALIAAGITVDALYDQLGIPAATTAHVALAPTMDDVDSYLAKRPEWERDAIGGLLAGMTIDEVREALELDAPAEKPAATTAQPTDEAVVKGMHKSASKQFQVVPESADARMLQQALDGSFPDWCVFLHPSQRRSVDADYSGPARVKGGAGTGKTVVALHRARRLTEADPHARVLLTTFTTTLPKMLMQQMKQLAPGLARSDFQRGRPGLTVIGLDKLIYQILEETATPTYTRAVREVTGLETRIRLKPMADNMQERIWEDALAIAGSDVPEQYRNPQFFVDEYRLIVVAQSIGSQAEYLKAPRPERHSRLNRAARKAVWRVVETFVTRAGQEGKLPFITQAVVAARCLDLDAEAGKPRPFTNVVVDEAQDFHIGHWRFVRALVEPGPNDIFMAEDPHERIYGKRLSLKPLGIGTQGRSVRLTLNYRTTRKTLEYAQEILQGTTWVGSQGDDDVDSLIGYRSVRGGFAPVIVPCQSRQEEDTVITTRIKKWLEDPKAYVGVLVRTRNQVTRLGSYLPNEGIPVNTGEDQSPRRGPSWVKPSEPARVFVSTMHSAKGMEFTHVILLDIDDRTILPSYVMDKLSGAAKAAAVESERALLYVASSRARDQLMVVYSGKPSRLLPELQAS